MKNLGERIYFHRTRCGLSQLDIAEKTGVSRQSVSKWENGNAVPELEKVVKLSEIFEITLDELVNGAMDSRPSKEDTPKASNHIDITHQIFSVIFILLALFALFFYELHISFWLFLPLLTTGFLLKKRPARAGLICMWTWFLSLDTFFLMAGSPFRHGLTLYLYILLLPILIIITVAAFRSEAFALSRKTSIFFAISVPLMPACGAFFRFFINQMNFPKSLIHMQPILSEIFIVDIFLAAFVICLIPTFYTITNHFKKTIVKR